VARDRAGATRRRRCAVAPPPDQRRRAAALVPAAPRAALASASARRKPLPLRAAAARPDGVSPGAAPEADAVGSSAVRHQPPLGNRYF